MRKLIDRYGVILILLLSCFYSCTDTAIQEIRSKNLSESISSGNQGMSLLSNTCTVNGETQVFPNQTCTYTYSDTYQPLESITWSVNSGAITLVSGQGTSTVVFSFGSNFSGGSIRAQGVSAGLACDEDLSISALPTLTISLTSIDEHPGHIYPALYTYTATNISGFSYSWYVNGALQSTSSTNVFSTRIPCGVQKTVEVRLTNACGTVTSNSISETGMCY